MEVFAHLPSRQLSLSEWGSVLRPLLSSRIVHWGPTGEGFSTLHDRKHRHLLEIECTSHSHEHARATTFNC